MVKLFALCAEGLEEVVTEELEEKGEIKNLEIYQSLIVFDYDSDLKNLAALKTVDDVLLLAKKFQGMNRYKTSLFKIRKQLSSVNLMKLLFLIRKLRVTKPETTFRIKSSYRGRRDYTAKEITASIRRAVKRTGWKNSKDSELHIHTILTPKISVCGISLLDEPLHVKNRIETIRGSLKSSVANAMLRLAKAKPDDIVFDPMCGSGMIPISASLLGCKAIGSDIDQDAVKIAEKNSKEKSAGAEFHVQDAAQTGLDNDSVDKVICNVPFEKQVKKSYDPEKFVEEIERITKKDSFFVMLMDPENMLKRILKKKYPQMESLIIRNSGLKARIVIIDRNIEKI